MQRDSDWISRFPSGFFTKTNWLLIVTLCDSCPEAHALHDGDAGEAVNDDKRFS
jgi:hypothetical protein